MMQTAQARAGDHDRRRTRFPFDWPAMRCVFAERVVNAVLVKVGDVFPDQPPQMPFAGSRGPVARADSFHLL